MKPRRLGNFYFLCLCSFIHSSLGTWNCEEIGSLTSWAQLSASSQKVLQKRQNLILWSPQSIDDSSPYLQFNFEEFVEVWELQVQSKTVMEFKLQYAEKIGDFRDLKEGKYGLPKVFFMHGEAQKLFSVDPSPVFAKAIRVIPLRWKEEISATISLNGCIFSRSKSKKKEEKMESLKGQSLQSVQFRFRTSEKEGVLLDGSRKGQEQDFLLALHDSQLHFKGKVSGSIGNFLDDNRFHSVQLFYSEDNNLTLILDGMQSESWKINGSAIGFDKVVVGRESQNGSLNDGYFKGCMRDFLLNEKHLVELPTQVERACQKKPNTALLSFTTTSSFLKVNLVKKKTEELRLRKEVSFDFRTLEANALILYHGLQSSVGSLKITLDNSRLQVGYQELLISDSFDIAYNDGKWHSVSLAISGDFVNLTIDNEILVRKAKQAEFGSQFLIGGGFHDNLGFIGCLRNINLLGSKIQLDMDGVEQKDVLEDVCVIDDKCVPNPCQHGGLCKQNSTAFTCECENGYWGPLCHTSINYRSCHDFALANPDTRYVETMLDLDGSGPLPQFSARCEFLPADQNLTYIGHLNEESTKVDGFDEKGSFVQQIHYSAPLKVIEVLTKSSRKCSQKLGYECKQSRLFNTPTQNTSDFYGYWTNRHGKIMDFWAGSKPGSYKCFCGLDNSCFEKEKGCNCDSGHNDWLWDGGLITQKEFLPVKSLHFGDTGTPLDGKEGRFSLGPLACESEDPEASAITFHLTEGALDIDISDKGQKVNVAWDVYFEFKTAVEDMSGVLFHAYSATDELLIELINGTAIKATLNGLELKASLISEESFNEWHSLNVEWNLQNFALFLDKNNSVDELQIQGYRPLQFQKAFLGANKDFLQGYTGCFRSLWVNGESIDLKREMEENYPKGVHGVKIGCIGACDMYPCENNGKCIEMYRDYTCDCSLSAFDGPFCRGDVSFNFNGSNAITANVSDTSGQLLIEMNLSVMDFDQDVAVLVDTTQLQIVLEPENSLSVIVGAESFQVVMDVMDTNRIHLRSFDFGRQLVLTYGIHQKVFVLQNTSLVLDTGFSVEIGKHFIGCISALRINDVFPLKYISTEESKCNVLQKLTRDIEETTTEYIDMTTLEFQNTEEDKNEEFSIMALFWICALISLILFIIYVVVKKYIRRHTGVYVTREDAGDAEALDADTAVLHSKTGHLVEKRQEWFF